MNTKQLHDAIKAKVRKARDARIWEKAYEIAVKLGKEDVRVGNWSTTVSNELTVVIDKKKLHIHKSNYKMGGDYLSISVDGARVFDANERISCELSSYNNLRKAQIAQLEPQSGSPEYLEIKYYIEGEWERLLDLKRISNVLRSEQIVKEQQERAAREHEEAARPLTDREKEVARNFGL